MGRTYVTTDELFRRLGQQSWPRVVDVRRRAAYESSETLIPGAHWRDHRRADDWGAGWRGTRVVVYCAHGHEVSQSAAALLRGRGVDALYLEGGLAAWREAGGPVVGRVARDRLPAPSRWVTRERPKIDRIACPWLIRRFLDPDAEIHFVEATGVIPIAAEIDGIPFDVPDTEYSHDGELCSFDAVLHRFQIADPVLDRLARIVRGADTGRLDLEPQCAGLLAVSLGLSAASDDDDATLARGMVVYDGLYAWLRLAATETHGWAPAAAGRE